MNTSPLRPVADPSPESYLAEVEAVMAQAATGPTMDRLGTIASEHLATGGKRLRARLSLLAASGLGLDPRRAVPWAAACELLHNATLIHDDIQDGDETRRGSPTVWVRHGVAQAINAGDLLLTLPYRVLRHLDASASQRWHLSEVLAEGAEQVARGQCRELELPHQIWLRWKRYAEASEGKTAALFEVPVRGAAILAGRSPEAARMLGEPFRRIGLLFQLQDDVLDLYGDKGRGLVGSDIYEGKVSALVCEHLERHPGDRNWLLATLRAPREQTSRTEVEAAIGRFREEGALDAVWERIHDLRREILDNPDLRVEPALLCIADSLVERALRPIAHVAPTGRARP